VGRPYLIGDITPSRTSQRTAHGPEYRPPEREYCLRGLSGSLRLPRRKNPSLTARRMSSAGTCNCRGGRGNIGVHRVYARTQSNARRTGPRLYLLTSEKTPKPQLLLTHSISLDTPGLDAVCEAGSSLVFLCYDNREHTMVNPIKVALIDALTTAILRAHSTAKRWGGKPPWRGASNRPCGGGDYPGNSRARHPNRVTEYRCHHAPRCPTKGARCCPS